MRRDDGGQAFPMPQAETSEGGHWEENGMSLRDWFAGQALAGLLAGSPDADCGPKGYSADAYSLADAMLATRDGGDDAA